MAVRLQIIRVVAMIAVIGSTLSMTMILPARADDLLDKAVRKGKWEIMLAPQFTLAKNLGFDGGTTAKIEDTVGFNFQFGYNFNEHWNVGGLFSWSRPDYQAVVQPVEGNPAGARIQQGTVETNTFALVTTYHFFTGPITPFVDLNFGGTHVHTDIADGPPVAGCYWDPWYGQICGVTQPTKNGTFFSYGVGGGVRWMSTNGCFSGGRCGSSGSICRIPACRVLRSSSSMSASSFESVS